MGLADPSSLARSGGWFNVEVLLLF